MEELLCTNKNIPSTSASFVHDRPKRRKEMEMTDVQVGTSRGRLDLTWKQTDEDVTIHTKLDAQDGEADKVEVSFTERQLIITLPDGRQQSWHFHDAIDETQSRVARSKRKFNITVVKKTSGFWPVLEASEEMTSGEEQQDQPAENSTEDMSHNNDLPDSLQEVRTKEEEPVLNLNHIKHDFFERDDTLTIHIYVKNVSKDAVKIHFDKQSFTVKFQTGDGKFLQLHEGTTEETVFCWTVNTKNAIIPAACKMKTTNTCIELRLKKASADRWATLEAPVKKESSSSKSTSWMPAKQNASSAGAIGSDGSGSSVVFDEMSGIDANRRDFSSSELPSTSQLNSSSSKSQKPTAKVHPLNTQTVALESRRLGFTGIDNPHNICYMNCVIQVLSNTRELRDYFIGGGFQRELNKNSSGKLAVCFAVVLKSLWNGNQSYIPPNMFMTTIMQQMKQFSGIYQHDAQEFLAFLLDGLHEDVNRVQKKTKTPPIEDANKPDHVVADESWAAYKKREDSFLVDLMYGQYRNRTTCPNCKEVSTSFDPFSILPLPLQKNKMTLNVTFMWRDPQRKPTKYQVQLIKDTTVEHLTEVLSHKTGVQPKNMRVFEVLNRLFSKRFKNSSDLGFENIRGFIVVSEVLSEDDAGEKVVVLEVIQRMLQPHHPVSCNACSKVCQNDTKLKRCTKCLKVGYCNQACQRDDWPLHKNQCTPGPQPVGCPFYLSLPHSHCTFGRIARLMESFARYSVDTFQPPVKTEPVVTPVVTLTSTTPTTSTASTSFKTPSTSTPSSTMLPPGSDLHLPSHPSASNLSSSSGSQSSGSLSSLDSISSCSSTATLTAETSHATFDVGQSGDEDEDRGVSDERGGGDVDSGIGSISSFQSGSSTQASSCGTAQGDTRREMGHEKEWASSSKTEKNTGGSTVQSVAASMSSERSVPLFFVKPVDEGGRGRRELERLEDKGDTVLDLSSTQSLSMDWRNNEKQPSYVLVQSKELECEEDESVKKFPAVTSQNLTLQQCLEHYHAPEILSERNAWTCAKCKSKQKAIKQCSLWKLPHIFIIQLKRFSSFFRKIDTKVEFPIRGLDLTPYKSLHNPGDPLALYDLYGVVNHIGPTAVGGHYTCRARCMNPEWPFQSEVDWRLFDDKHVSLVSNEKRVVDSNAYLLFYRRRETFKPPPPVKPIAAAPAEEETRTEVITEKNEEESSKEQHMEDGPSEFKVNWDSAEREVEKEESQEEKHDAEKDEDESEEQSGSDGNLVIDLEPSWPVSLGYTDMDAVD